VPCGVDELGAAAVVEGDPELQPRLVGRRLLELGHLLAQPVGRAVAAAEEAAADSLSGEILELPVDRLAERLHQGRHLVGRAAPVLGREGVDRERVDAEVDRRLDDRPQRAGAGAVPVGDRDAVLGGPAPVAVHDDRDRVRDLGEMLLRRDVGPRQGGH
jgi:hypothetical protein